MKQRLFSPEGNIQGGQMMDRLDGDLVMEQPADTPDAKMAVKTARMMGELLGGRPLYRRPGFSVNGWFVSAELLLTAVIAVASVICVFRIKKI